MNLTPREQPVVLRAVTAYQAKKAYEGPFRGPTADEILVAVCPAKASSDDPTKPTATAAIAC